MKKSFLLTIGALLALGLPSNVHAANCQPTGFVRDSINLTAALINPAGTVMSMLDATGCHIGIYYDGGHDAKMEGADVSGASHYGVLVNTDNGGTSTVSIKHSVVHHIGDVPHTGNQYGIAISLRGFTGVIKGAIDSNQVLDYQKGGITANGAGVSIGITGNVVIGDGHIAANAQNGIQIAFGAKSQGLTGNFVYGNSYTGDPGDGSSSSGILIAGGPGFNLCPPVDAPCDYTLGASVLANVLFANDVGVYAFNIDGAGMAPAVPSNVVISRNVIYGDLCYNKVFQAGVSDVGNSDSILGNTIYGPGYIKCASGTTIDVLDAVNPTIRNRAMSPSQHPYVYPD